MPAPEILPARLPKSAVRPTYTWIAPTHDVLAVLVERKARRLGLEWLGVQNGERLLEVAVGTGLSFGKILRQNPDGWTEGVDLTPAMLRRAEKRAARASTKNYRLRLADAYALPFPDAHFDGLFNSYMFDLLPERDFEPVLGEFARVLRPGGRLVQVNMTKGRRPYNALWEWIYRLSPPLLGGCRGVEMAPHFERVGLRRVRRAYVSEWTFPSEVVFGVKPERPPVA